MALLLFNIPLSHSKQIRSGTSPTPLDLIFPPLFTWLFLMQHCFSVNICAMCILYLLDVNSLCRFLQYQFTCSHYATHCMISYPFSDPFPSSALLLQHSPMSLYYLKYTPHAYLHYIIGPSRECSWLWQDGLEQMK